MNNEQIKGKELEKVSGGTEKEQTGASRLNGFKEKIKNIKLPKPPVVVFYGGPDFNWPKPKPKSDAESENPESKSLSLEELGKISGGYSGINSFKGIRYSFSQEEYDLLVNEGYIVDGKLKRADAPAAIKCLEDNGHTGKIYHTGIPGPKDYKLSEYTEFSVIKPKDEN